MKVEDLSWAQQQNILLLQKGFRQDFFILETFWPFWYRESSISRFKSPNNKFVIPFTQKQTNKKHTPQI